MGYFKIDKLDKIVIAFTFIVVSMFSIFNCFSFASEEEQVEVIKVDDLIIRDDKIIRFDGGSLGYFPIEKGYKYTFKQNAFESGSVNIGFSNLIPAEGVDVFDKRSLSFGQTFSFNSYENNYLYLDFSFYRGDYEITKEKLSTFSSVIYNLSENVSFNLWNIFSLSLPFVLIVVVVVFGIYLITRMIKGVSKGKGRV